MADEQTTIAVQRYLDELAGHPGMNSASSGPASLSPSLLADLQRFEHRPAGTVERETTPSTSSPSGSGGPARS